jgi:hypothetical protein
MNNVDDEINIPDAAGATTSPSSSDVSAELDVDGNVNIGEPTAVPPIPVGGHSAGSMSLPAALCRETSGIVRTRRTHPRRGLPLRLDRDARPQSADLQR